MKTRNIISTMKIFLMLMAIVAVMTACDEEDPFVDRTVAPVLLVFDGVQGYLAGGGLTSVPTTIKTVTPANVSEPVELSVYIYQLDKSGILDHTIGIDSIPVANLTLMFSKRDGSLPIEVISDTSGKATVSTTWEDLGIVDPATRATAKIEINIGLSWRGEYEGQSFVRYSQVQFKVQ
jgi:hypothetical protein